MIVGKNRSMCTEYEGFVGVWRSRDMDGKDEMEVGVGC